MMNALPDWDDISLNELTRSFRPRNIHSSSPVVSEGRDISNLQPSPKSSSDDLMDTNDMIRGNSRPSDSSRIGKHSSTQSLHDTTDQSIFLNSKYDSEIFSYRELMLQISESCRFFGDYIKRIDDHIINNGDIDEKAVQSLQRFVFEFTQPTVSNTKVYDKLLKRLPREATLLYESEKKLERLVDKMLKSFVECMQTRKNFYSTQIKKLRDQCNLAIRQALQVLTN
jgi:hypothetical protein